MEHESVGNTGCACLFVCVCLCVISMYVNVCVSMCASIRLINENKKK